MIARETTTAGVGRQLRLVGFGLFTAFAMLGQIGPANAVEAAQPAERFEIAGVKAVRPTLVNTIAALQKHDIAGAKSEFEAYDYLLYDFEMHVRNRSTYNYYTQK